MGSMEEKLISLDTARHFRIFFGTLASCSASGTLRSSLPWGIWLSHLLEFLRTFGSRGSFDLQATQCLYCITTLNICWKRNANDITLIRPSGVRALPLRDAGGRNIVSTFNIMLLSRFALTILVSLSHSPS